MNISFKGSPLTIDGKQPEVGEKFPEFILNDNERKEIHLKDLLDKPVLISVVPDINTSVCSLQTKKFNEEVDKYSEINFVTVSTNTIEEQIGWCAAEGVHDMLMLSDAKLDFGEKTSLYTDDLGIDIRSIWIIDTNGKLVYREIVTEQSHEPNYADALDYINEMYTN